MEKMRFQKRRRTLPDLSIRQPGPRKAKAIPQENGSFAADVAVPFAYDSSTAMILNSESKKRGRLHMR